MREQINAAMKDAMKAGEKTRLSTLRLITAALKDRDIAARGAGQERVSDAEVVEVLARMIKQRRESAQTYEDAGRIELAEQERDEIAVIETFLPAQIEGAELEAAVDGALAELNCEGLRDMGRTMAHLKSKYPGQMDFSKASALVKQKLG